jgi:uncharacterized DUF497 family protein
MRGLEFARCTDIFAGEHVTFEDVRKDCGGRRYFSVGYLNSRMLVVWTPRDGHERIISMRKANDREQRDYRYKLDR